MGRFWDSSWGMICAGFLSPVDRADLTALARDGSAAHRLARRANALVLLDSGWSCEKVAGALLLDDDTIRRWHGLFIEDGLEGLTRFEAGGSACQMNGEQQENLKAWVAAALPRSTRQIGAWIEQEFGHVYAGRSRDRSNPNDRGRNRRRRLDDQASGIDRGGLSDAGPHPYLSRQRTLSSREDRAGMARSAGAANKAALHPALLPASEPDRAAMGRDAQACHAQ